MNFRFDLHVHSCLSPCAELEMSPLAIARRAGQAGLNALALCDHNSARNAPAFEEVCRSAGIAALYGLEIATAEEFHVLTLFDTVPQALEMTAFVYAHLPPRLNQPAVFGSQAVVNAREEIEEFEPHLLSAPVLLPLHVLAARLHALDGLLVASHVDRPCFSVFSQWGGISGDEGFDAMELSAGAPAEPWAARVCGLPFVRDADAHQLAALGRVWNEADMPAFSIAALRHALRNGQVHISPPARMVF